MENARKDTFASGAREGRLTKSVLFVLSTTEKQCGSKGDPQARPRSPAPEKAIGEARGSAPSASSLKWFDHAGVEEPLPH